MRKSSKAIPEEMRDHLRKMVATHGERRACEVLGTNPHTLSRALAGLGCYPGTIALLEAGLSQIGSAP
jgi:hypothetical protein